MLTAPCSGQSLCCHQPYLSPSPPIPAPWWLSNTGHVQPRWTASGEPGRGRASPTGRLLGLRGEFSIRSIAKPLPLLRIAPGRVLRYALDGLPALILPYLRVTAG